MKHVVELIAGHPLSPDMSYRLGELTCDGLRITSLEMGMNYIQLYQNGKVHEATSLLENMHAKWQPVNIAYHYTQKLLSNPLVAFEIRKDRVYEALVIAQLVDQKDKNPIRSEIDDIITEAAGKDIEFRTYGADRVMNVGYKHGFTNRYITEGQDVYGKILTRVTKLYQRGKLDASENAAELHSMVADPAAFETSFSRSVLIVTDSQGGHFDSVTFGDVVAVSGAKYGDIANVFYSEKYDIDAYRYILVYAGTNCALTPSYTAQARASEASDLVEVLKNCAKKRTEGVFFCSSVNTTRPSSKELEDRNGICAMMDLKGIRVLNWNQFEANPYFRYDGKRRDTLFRDNVHFNEDGAHHLWKSWCREFESLMVISYKTRDRPRTVPKERFAHVKRPVVRESIVVNVPKSPEMRKSPLVDPKGRKSPEMSYFDEEDEIELIEVDSTEPSTSRAPESRSPSHIRSVVIQSRSPRSRWDSPERYKPHRRSPSPKIGYRRSPGPKSGYHRSRDERRRGCHDEKSDRKSRH